MKKKLAGLLVTAVMLCGCLGLSAMAAKTPSLEMVDFHATVTQNSAYNPVLYYRNNTNKTIKYIDWYVSARNRVGDKISGDAAKVLSTVGPVEPFQVLWNANAPLNTRVELEDNSPFKRYRETNYKISIGDYQQSVYQDEYGNFFVQSNKYSGNTGIYLTKDEVENAMYMQWCEFPDTWWFSNVIDHLNVDGVMITYMDGSIELISDVGSKYRSMTLQNPPFVQQLAQYQAVYNYQDYLTYNPDLAALYGADQKKLFDHFVTSGMKEGRRGSSEFDLNTYKANNPELVAMFGDDNVKYYEHYIASGKAEGRTAA